MRCECGEVVPLHQDIVHKLTMRLDYLLALGAATEPQFLFSGKKAQPAFSIDEAQDHGSLPLVIWHGLGDNYNSLGMVEAGEIAAAKYPGIFVYRIRIHDDPKKDQQLSLVGEATLQLAAVCEQIGDIPELKDGFDMIGFSQGGLFARALVQSCNNATVRNLVTFGSPHMGVLELPRCADERDWLCKRRNALLKRQVWYDLIQRTIIPAQYFRDTSNFEKYSEHSHFLAPMNNEANERQNEYGRRLNQLENFVMVQFKQDTTVVPKESAVFGEINPETGEVVPMEQTLLYQEDLLGLRLMKEAGKLQMEEIDGAHMAIPTEFYERVVERYVGRV